MCWEQFLFMQPSCSSVFCVPSDGNVHIEYWLIGYFKTYQTCPSTDIPGDGGISDTNDWRQDQATGNSCLVDTDNTDTNTEHITSLSQFSLKGEIGSGQDCVTFISPLEEESPWTTCEDDSVLGLSQSWTDVEFNVFGFGNGSQANFNTGTSITVEIDAIQQGTNLQPVTCPSEGFTAETNNLNRVGSCNAVPASAPFNGAISFRESTFQFSVSSQSNPLNFVMLNGGTATFQVGTLTLVSGPADTVTLSVNLGKSTLGPCAPTFISSSVTPTAAGAAISLTIQLPVPTNSNCLGDFTLSISANDGPLSQPVAPANLHIYDFSVTAPSNMQVLTTGSNMFTITVALTPGSSTTNNGGPDSSRLTVRSNERLQSQYRIARFHLYSDNNRLERTEWYLHVDDYRYRFSYAGRRNENVFAVLNHPDTGSSAPLSFQPGECVPNIGGLDDGSGYFLGIQTRRSHQ